jgi:ATP-binding cassette subfamily C protein CydD
LAFLKGISQQDNQKAFDVNEIREKQCVEWLNAKKKEFSSSINIAGLIGVANGILIIIQSALLAYLFQQLLIEKQPWQQLKEFFIFLTLIFILRSISSYYFQVLGFKVSTAVKRSVRGTLLDKFFMLGPGYTKQHQSGELATLTLEQTEALEGYYSRYLPQQLIVSILPLIIITVVIPINWVDAIIFLVTGPLIA